VEFQNDQISDIKTLYTIQQEQPLSLLQLPLQQLRQGAKIAGIWTVRVFANIHILGHNLMSREFKSSSSNQYITPLIHTDVYNTTGMPWINLLLCLDESKLISAIIKFTNSWEPEFFQKKVNWISEISGWSDLISCLSSRAIILALSL